MSMLHQSQENKGLEKIRALSSSKDGNFQIHKRDNSQAIRYQAIKYKRVILRETRGGLSKNSPPRSLAMKNRCAQYSENIFLPDETLHLQREVGIIGHMIYVGLG